MAKPVVSSSRAGSLRIALLGAESTGKTRLADELAAHFRESGRSATVVSEVLREWCEREGRTPRPQEQLPIAQEQERRVDAASGAAEVVIADTTALMVAVYSALLFEDGTLYRFALKRLATYHVTLLTGLDIPWVADGLQRDGPHVREPVDALIRSALAQASIPYHVVYGHGGNRLVNALAAITTAMPSQPGQQDCRPATEAQRWMGTCEKCSDPQCEHRLFTARSN